MPGSLGVDVVTVNWNSGSQLRECIAAVGDSVGVAPHVWVVDNASGDHSHENLPAVPCPLTVIANTTNVGFGAGCNQGATLGEAPYILFLNPDVVVEKSSIVDAIRKMEGGDTNIVACSIQLLDRAGNVARSCRRLPTPGMLWATILGIDRWKMFASTGYIMREWPHDTDRFVGHLIGAFYLVRRSAFERVGGFDEQFFMYFEDLDLSARLQQNGDRLLFTADTCAFHAGGGTTYRIKARRLLYSWTSRIRYASKHFSRSHAFALTLGTIFIEPFVRAGAAIATLDVKGAVEAIQAWGAFVAQLPRRSRPVEPAQSPRSVGRRP